MRPKEVVTALQAANKAGVSVILLGRSGIGKTQIPQDMAKQEGRGCYVVKLPQHEPVELKGLPKYTEDGKGTFFTMGPIIKKAWELQEEFGKPPVIVVDELGNAEGSQQTAAYEIFHELSLGGWKLPEGTFVVGTSNAGMDKAYTHLLAFPLVNRCSVLELEPNWEDWIQYAIKHRLHYTVIGFINFREGDLLFNFDPDAYSDSSYPAATPRQWENVSKILYAVFGVDREPTADELSQPWLYHLLQGMIGKGPVTEFLAFVKYFDEIPSKAEILNDPDKAKVPTKNNSKYAVACAIQGWAGSTEESVKFMPYIERLPMEYQGFVVRAFCLTYPGFLLTKECTTWNLKHGSVLSGGL